MREKGVRNAFAGAGRFVHHIQWQYLATYLRVAVNCCTGYLARPFLKMRREQRFSIVLFYNFLKVYASNFNFLQ